MQVADEAPYQRGRGDHARESDQQAHDHGDRSHAKGGVDVNRFAGAERITCRQLTVGERRERGHHGGKHECERRVHSCGAHDLSDEDINAGAENITEPVQ